MSEEQPSKTSQTEGPTMLVATSMLNPPTPVTNLKIIPRTIPWVNLGIIIGCALLGFAIASAAFGSDFETMIMSSLFGGAIGFALPYLSPLEGESIGKWIGLKARDITATRVTLNGERVRMYIGTYPLRRTALGTTRITPSGIAVKAYEYDERGYPQVSSPKSSAELVAQRRHRNSQNLRASSTLQAPKSRVKAAKEMAQRAQPRLPHARVGKKDLAASGKIPHADVKARRRWKRQKR